MQQAAAQSSMSNVLLFPTASRVAHRQPARWWERPLPGNVQCLRELPPKRTLSPEALLISAFIEANAMSGTLEKRRPNLMDVNESLKDALDRFEGDREGQASVYAAMKMLWAYRTGQCVSIEARNAMLDEIDGDPDLEVACEDEGEAL